MFLRKSDVLCGLALAMAVVFAGCNSSSEAEMETPAASVPASHDNHSQCCGGKSGEVAKAMATLSAADRQAAMQQKICPVTEEPLGSMGAPIKVRAAGQDVFICCEGCREELLDNAGAYVARLNR